MQISTPHEDDFVGTQYIPVFATLPVSPAPIPDFLQYFSSVGSKGLYTLLVAAF
jgi:hypothetical protein